MIITDIFLGIWQFIKDMWMIFTNFDKMIKFSEFSLLLILAPFLVKILPFPFQYMMGKMKYNRDKASFAKNLSAFNKKINNQIDLGQKIQINSEQFGYLPQITKDRLKNMQKGVKKGVQEGGFGAMSVLASSPGFIEYISTILLIVFVYWWETSGKCGVAVNKKRTDNENLIKEKEKITGDLKNGKGVRDEAQSNIDNAKKTIKNLGLGYSFTQLFWDGLYTSIIPMIMYFGFYTFLIFIPFIGMALKIIQMIPIVNKLFGGTMIYFFYNVMRNFRDITKRNKCQ
tara:strand:+ start:291 stop:1145 length:855 start_codon:yes stop_codon:yes gene_type:complete